MSYHVARYGQKSLTFWFTCFLQVDVSTDELPDDKPRYLMGVGFAVDLVVCSALGCDMFDCVYPTRTARFGSALVRTRPGILNLRHNSHRMDFGPIEDGCECSTCQSGVSRSYIQSLLSTKQTAACHLISVHNVWFQLNLMSDLRQSVKEDRFPSFVKEFFAANFESKAEYPKWATDALKAVNIDLLSTEY